MSVQTDSDEKIKNAKNLLSEAIKELLLAVDENTWGHDQYQDGYIDDVLDVMNYYYTKDVVVSGT